MSGEESNVKAFVIRVSLGLGWGVTSLGKVKVGSWFMCSERLKGGPTGSLVVSGQVSGFR